MVLGQRLWRRLFKHAKPSVKPVLVIPPFVTLGNACALDPTVQFREHDGQTITLHDHVMLRRGCELCGDISIGVHTRLNRDVYVRPHTHIGRNVSIGPFVQLVTDSHELANVNRRAGRTFYDPIVVGDGAWIGAGSIILGGVRIGRGAVIGAGSVVTRDVEPDTLYAGTPARKIRDLPPLLMIDEASDAPRPPENPRPLRPAA